MRYPPRIVKGQVDRALKFSLEHDTHQNKKEYGISLDATFMPTFKNLSVVLQKNFKTRKLENLFVAYRSAQNLQSFLVKFYVYPIERTVASSKM